MDAVLIQIADAVTAELNGATLSQDFTAVRVYVPLHDNQELVDLKVTVVPNGRHSTLLDRGGRAFNDYVVDVGVQKSLPQGPLTDVQLNAACDPLMSFAEEIVSLFYTHVLTTYPAARCTSIKNEPVYYPAHVDQQGTFTSVVSLTFRIGK